MIKYAKTHEWVKIEGDKATIGLSDHAQHELGDIVFINLPQEGDGITAGEAFCDAQTFPKLRHWHSAVCRLPRCRLIICCCWQPPSAD